MDGAELCRAHGGVREPTDRLAARAATVRALRHYWSDDAPDEAERSCACGPAVRVRERCYLGAWRCRRCGCWIRRAE